MKRAFEAADLTPFGRRLREAIETAGYTQTSFERAAGFGKGYLTKLLYEPSVRGVSFDNIEKIESLTGVRIQYIARGELPKHEGEPHAPVKKAAALARSEGVAQDVIAHITRRNADAEWTLEEWYRAFREANRRAIEDPAWRVELRRVSMSGEKKSFTESEGETAPSPENRAAKSEPPPRRRRAG